MNLPLPFPHQGGAPVMTAQAKEMASGTGSRVNKDAESLLRYGLPINNKEVSSEESSLLSLNRWRDGFTCLCGMTDVF